MKIPIVLFILLLIGCSKNMVPTQFENQLVVTKQYAGKMMYNYFDGKYTHVITDERIILVCGDVYVPDSSHCYIRITPVYIDAHPDIKENLRSKYFSYNGKEYRIKTW